MKEFNFFEKIVAWFKSFFTNKEKAKEKSDKIKKEMCEKAAQDDVCSHCCEDCAWNVLD